MDEPKGKFIFKEADMLDHKSIVRMKRLGLNNAAIANSPGCKWDSVQRIVSRCENLQSSVDGVPDDLTNEHIRIYYREKLIAEHQRAARKCQKSTLEAHIPGKGTGLREAYSSDELISWAEKFGPYTVRWVKAELGRVSVG